MRRLIKTALNSVLPKQITQARTLEGVCDLATSEAERATVVDTVIERLVRPQHQAAFWGDRLLTLDKAAGFTRDPAFKTALADTNSNTGQNQYASPDGISWRFHTLIWAAQSCLNLPGDFVECGTYRGDMSWVLSEVVDIQGAGKKFYLYDTFAGFDPRYSSPTDFPHSDGFFAMVDASYKDPTNEMHVRGRFAAKPYVVVTKGSVPDILAEVSPERISFLHLDLNSAAAERGALEVLFDRLSPGGIIVFDDYGWAVHFKQKEAIDTFMNAKGIPVLELPTGQAMSIKR